MVIPLEHAGHASAQALSRIASIPVVGRPSQAVFETGRPRKAVLRLRSHRRTTMPELPDIVVYIESLQPRIQGQPLQRIRLVNPFLLRSVEPPIGAAEGRTVVGLRRLGKRIVFALEDDLFLILHLMIAGRL